MLPPVIAALSAIMLAGLPAHAETLTGALSLAYTNNPTLRAERANVRAVDETVAQAISGWRPTISSSADYGFERSTNKPGGVVKTEPHGASVSVTQPLFRGFRTVNSTREADANVFAARHNLVNTEQTILLQVVTAFMNVVRDQAIVALRSKNVMVLREQLRASNARFKVGEITRTDVAQSRARLSGTISGLSLARATLAASRADYARVVGKPPGTLRRKRSDAKLLPRNFKEALATARQRHPLLIAAEFAERASHHAINSAKGVLLPEARLEARHDRRYDLGGVVRNNSTSSIVGRIDVPFYQSGAEYSRIRQAEQVNSQRRIQIVETERTIRAEVISAWEALRAARQSIQANRTQVSANSLALRGVREEARVGSRTTLDVLDAEQELLDSNVALVSSRRDEVVARYRLLAAIGRMTALDLKLHVKIYDPAMHYKYVRYKWIGFGRKRRESP